MGQIKSRYRKISKLLSLSSKTIHEFGFKYFITAALWELRKNKLGVLAPEPEQSFKPYSKIEAYKIWKREHRVSEETRSIIKKEIESFTNKPKISIVISVSEKNRHRLKDTIFSIKNQLYDLWEVRFACTKSLSEQVNATVTEMPDSRIIISEHVDSANGILSPTTSDFTLFSNSGDLLMKDSLFRIVQFLNKTPDSDVLYFDEEQIKSENQLKPFFKPDWSPDLFLSMDYISNSYIVKTKLLNECEGFRDQFGDAKHYDMLLRLSEKTKKIFHVPTIGASVNVSYEDKESSFVENAKKALSDALSRRNIKGIVSDGIIRNTFRIKYLTDESSRVSIIISTKDQKELLKRCITNIKKNASYKNYEIIIVDNNSVQEETIAYLKSLPYTVIKYDSPFNFSKICNLAASRASGDYLLFLNDDAAPLERDWLSEMVSICQQENIGIVGAKLVLASNVIQHAGVALLETGAAFHPMQGLDINDEGYFGFLNVIRNCSAITGACLLIRKKVFDKVNGFDETFDLYYQDVDLCLKVAKEGYRVVYTPYALLLHQGSSSIKKQSRAFFAVENHYLFLKKWPNLRKGDPYYNTNFAWDYKIKTHER